MGFYTESASKAGPTHYSLPFVAFHCQRRIYSTSRPSFAHAACVLTAIHPYAELAPVGKEDRSEEHTSELQSLLRTSYAVFCLKKKHLRHRPTHHGSDA